MQAALTSNNVVGDGPFAARAEAMLCELSNARKALLTTSCTHALEMAAIMLDLQPGDEVIVPSFTFVSSALAFVMHGARPVFVDIRPDTLNIDENAVAEAISPRTRAIVVVHYAGVACEMDNIMALAAPHDIVVIEDNAHGFMGAYHDRALGSIGHFATLSFHATKNLTCGEGGALLINDERFVERAEIVREKGTNRSQFRRGAVDKYTWVDVGSSYVLSDILAACLLAQLEQARAIQADRERSWQQYSDTLGAWAADRGIGLPRIPAHCRQTWHMYYLLLSSNIEREQVRSHLEQAGVQSATHYEPLHSSPAGRRFAADVALPCTDHAAGTILRLPLYGGMKPADIDQVTGALLAYR